MRMFLVSLNITAADIIVFMYVAEYFKELLDFYKIEPNIDSPAILIWLNKKQDSQKSKQAKNK